MVVDSASAVWCGIVSGLELFRDDYTGLSGVGVSLELRLLLFVHVARSGKERTWSCFLLLDLFSGSLRTHMEN